MIDPPSNGPPTTSDSAAYAMMSEREKAAWEAIASVTDPEIPVLSIVEMGMVSRVEIARDAVTVDLTPTFVGCPAIDLIRSEIIGALRTIGENNARIRVVFEPPWTSDRITEAGRRKLLEFGIAPPGGSCGQAPRPLEHVPCPFCGSIETDLESIFGPTLCRSIHYCRACLQTFEHFKPV